MPHSFKRAPWLAAVGAGVLLAGCGKAARTPPGVGGAAPVPVPAVPSPEPPPSTGAVRYEGWGGRTRGGEGEEVVWVTTTKDEGPGSLRAALAGGKREIRFKAGGTFKGPFKIAHPFVTLDGGDAPAPGVNITGAAGIIVASSDVVVRGVRVRGTKDDGIRIADGARDVVVDHCSVSETGDGCIDVTDWNGTGVANVTVSWCVLGPAEKVMLISKVKTVSIHHNLFAGGDQRHPQLNAEAQADIRHNVICEWTNYGIRVQEGSKANVVGNLFLPAKFAPGKAHRAAQGLIATGEVYAQGNGGAANVNPDAPGARPLEAPALMGKALLDTASEVIEKAGAGPRDDRDRAAAEKARAGLDRAREEAR